MARLVQRKRLNVGLYYLLKNGNVKANVSDNPVAQECLKVTVHYNSKLLKFEKSFMHCLFHYMISGKIYSFSHLVNYVTSN